MDHWQAERTPWGGNMTTCTCPAVHVGQPSLVSLSLCTLLFKSSSAGLPARPPACPPPLEQFEKSLPLQLRFLYAFIAFIWWTLGTTPLLVATWVVVLLLLLSDQIPARSFEESVEEPGHHLHSLAKYANRYPPSYADNAAGEELSAPQNGAHPGGQVGNGMLAS
jgi:hypothetical protein